MAKCNQLTSLPFKGLNNASQFGDQSLNSFVLCCWSNYTVSQK